MTGPRPNADVADRDPGKPGTKPEAVIKWLIAAVVVLAVLIGALIVFASLTSTEPDSSDPTASPLLDLSQTSAAPPINEAQYVMDSKGWRDSPARCESSERPMVTGRTEHALVVVCSGPAGLIYKGVRIDDGDAISIGGVQPLSWAYIAENNGVRYRVTISDLTISSEDEILAQDPFLDYRGNTLATATPSSTSQPVNPRPTSTPRPSGSPFGDWTEEDQLSLEHTVNWDRFVFDCMTHSGTAPPSVAEPRRVPCQQEADRIFGRKPGVRGP